MHFNKHYNGMRIYNQSLSQTNVTFHLLLFPARPTLWDMEFANQLSLLTNQIPRNGFDEIIQWTKEGKLWQYPVNNEAGE